MALDPSEAPGANKKVLKSFSNADHLFNDLQHVIQLKVDPLVLAQVF
jgi:hypothetical protein